MTSAPKSTGERRRARGFPWRATLATPRALATAFVVMVAATFGSIGADSRWAAALGERIAATGRIPDGVPFATAPSAGWHNVPVLAELAFYALQSLAGDYGLFLAQLAAALAAAGLLGAAARLRGASEPGVALATAIAVVGAFPAFTVARLQLFSLVLFAGLVLLLEAETLRPTRRIWLLVPLAALWSNLHGAVLLGLLVASAYLLLERARREPAVAGGVLVCSWAAALTATPAWLDTPRYFAGVLQSEAATRGVGLWAPVRPTSPFDVLLVVAALLLVAGAIRTRPRLWAIVVLAGLALVTARAARNGVWLLAFAAPQAARAAAIPFSLRPRVVLAAEAVLLALAALGLVRGPLSTGADAATLRAAIGSAGGSPILAEDVFGEQVALAGGRVWATNPLDAFPRSVQGRYLDWLEGRRSAAAALGRPPRIVIVHADSRADDRLASSRRYTVFLRHDRTVVYRLTQAR